MSHLALIKTGMFLVSTLASASSSKPSEIAFELIKQIATPKGKTQSHPELLHCDTCHTANVRLLKQAS